MEILGNKIKSGYKISFEEAVELSRLADKEELYTLANNLRKYFMGDKMDTCSIINARSGKCSEDCKWCSQSKFHDTNIDVYPLIDSKEAVDMASHNASKGVGRFSLVTSGRTMTISEIKRVCAIYDSVKEKADIKLCASMGLLGREELMCLKNSGIGHYHCNLETAPSFFSSLCTTHTPEEKIQTITWAKEVGMKICSGGIIGMGETMEHRIELAMALRDIDADSIPINILNPIKGTALEGMQPLSDEDILTTFALFRIINPKAMIRFAGGRLQIAHIQQKALKCGVNGALVGDLLTTIGSDIDSDKKMFLENGFTL